MRKYLKSVAIVGAIISTWSLGIIGNTLAQENTFDLVLRILTGENCQGSTEIKYRSQSLISPDGKTSVYYDVVLRRLGQPDSRLIGRARTRRCRPFKGKTASARMIIQKDSGQIIKDLPIVSEALVLLTPVSFSTESRYLIEESQVSNGFSSYTSYSIIDSKTNFKPLSLSPCQKAEYGGTYKGFLSPNEIVFECNGDPRGKRGETIYEILNLQQRFIRLESIQFENPNSPPTSSYGSISRPFSVVKVQQFPK